MPGAVSEGLAAVAPATRPKIKPAGGSSGASAAAFGGAQRQRRAEKGEER